MKKQLQQIRQKLDKVLLPYAAKSRLAATLYYAFLTRIFAVSNMPQQRAGIIITCTKKAAA